MHEVLWTTAGDEPGKCWAIRDERIECEATPERALDVPHWAWGYRQ